MTAIDYRNANFADIQATLQGKRLAALSAWREHGPGTTREVAEKSGMDLLTFRPRTTELLQLGLIGVADPDAGGHEGIYRALTEEEALTQFRLKQAEFNKEAQLGLSI
ncbi:hypothetical protein AYO49_05480 [Verrucomicrobiaceae bacterium SCGC AG-212-N21]|nr:hypothetical protein AYO49_05480 [Verrucomicrobiaceae bacterium SCGC AG-212-N21]